MPKASNPTDIKKLTAQGVDIELKEEDMDDMEPTAKDIAANASIAKLKSKYEEVTKQMKAVVNKYKSAEGAEKDKYVAQLKTLTKLKKEIEAMINPTADEEED
jgi:galactitol-specific phosphotransferase system IIB component